MLSSPVQVSSSWTGRAVIKLEGLQCILHAHRQSSYGDIGGEMLSKMSNAAGCAGPELLELQHNITPSFEMRGSFLGKPLAGSEQLPDPQGGSNSAAF